MKITEISFRNENWGFTGPADISSECLSINKNGEIRHEQYSFECKQDDGPSRTKDYKVNGGLSEFFDRLDSHYHIQEWKPSYKVPVCNGFSWTCTYRTEDNMDHKIEGTIDPPPMGTELVEEIYELAPFEPGPWILCGYSSKYAIKKLKPFYDAFSGAAPEDPDILDLGLGQVCWKLGYKMDSFDSYNETGLSTKFLQGKTSEDELRQAFHDLDYATLSSMLFSQWRGITHWSQCGFEDFYSFFKVVLELMLDHLDNDSEFY